MVTILRKSSLMRIAIVDDVDKDKFGTLISVCGGIELFCCGRASQLSGFGRMRCSSFFKI